MSQRQNLLPDNPSLKDVLDMYGKGLKLDINCHHICTIESFDPSTQTAKATVNYQRTYFEPDELNPGSYKPNLVDYPILLDCPVVCMGGGNGALTFPITPGDECLALFNDRDFSDWVSTGLKSNPVPTGRIHSFADAILLVGIRSVPNVIPSYSTDAIELRTKDGLTKISLSKVGDKVTINVGPAMTMEIDATGQLKITNVAGEFVDALFQLLTAIQGGTVLGVQIILPPTFATNLAILGTFV